MIKRIIFDLDDTLIDFDSYYWDSIKSGLKDLGLNNDKHVVDSIICAFLKYELKVKKYNKKRLLKVINKETKLKLGDNFIDRMNYYFSNCVPKKTDQKLINMLEILSKKYELVILTNSFYDVQLNRLKKMKIDKYFINIYAGDKYICKPYKKSYIIACNGHKRDECVVVGDNILYDTLKPIQYGLEAILLDKYNKYEEYKGLKIKEIYDLSSIL